MSLVIQTMLLMLLVVDAVVAVDAVAVDVAVDVACC